MVLRNQKLYRFGPSSVVAFLDIMILHEILEELLSVPPGVPGEPLAGVPGGGEGVGVGGPGNVQAGALLAPAHQRQAVRGIVLGVPQLQHAQPGEALLDAVEGRGPD